MRIFLIEKHSCPLKNHKSSLKILGVRHLQEYNERNDLNLSLPDYHRMAYE